MVLFGILFRQRESHTFGAPEDVDNVKAFSIIEKLDAVNAPVGDGTIFGLFGFVSAENVGDCTVRILDTVQFSFVESAFYPRGEKLNVLLG